MRFAGKVALIAGASEGIGRASAVLLASEGADVVVVARNGERLANLAEEVKAHGHGVLTVVADCVKEEDVQSAVRKAVEKFGRIDILVNCIGGSTVIKNARTLVEDMSLAEFESLVQFNLVPTFLMCKHVGPLMKAQGSGKIVNLSSTASRGQSGASSGAYSAAKAGVIALTRKLAHELGPSGVHCNGIAPGLVLTERINRHVVPNFAPAAAAALLDSIPLRRHSMPEDQARVVAFLASRDSDMVTGVTIDVAGGL